MERHERNASRRGLLPAAVAAVGLLLASPAAAETPAEMVATYHSLADGVLALKQTEKDLVRSILAAAYAHASVQKDRAKAALAAKDTAGAKAALEALAAAIGELATEGDSAVAAVRKKLIDGGYHHNAAGEAQGIFEPGYVIVTRAHKAKLLESSRAIAQLAAKPDAAALDAEFAKVGPVVQQLLKPAK
ncbi:MAG TPA: hypothetical protein VNK41_09685 [Vicinamibacterales bacterium]|nr:hypothetical protein [Vicinamibacterales bacterium]